MDSGTKIKALVQKSRQRFPKQPFRKPLFRNNEHINKIYLEGELHEENTMRKFGNSEFSTKPTNFYNLDVIIAVGYRVNSKRATAFRIWVSKILKEHIVNDF